MTEIVMTDAEREAGRMSPEHLDAACAATDQDGFVVLANAVDVEHLRMLRERMLDDLDLLLRRPDAPYNWNTGNVQQEPPPFPPYLFRDVLLNDLVVQVTAEILGPKVKNHYYSGNTAMPSEARQPVHTDTNHLWKARYAPPHQVVVNISVVDVSASNGSTEIWPGSHRDASRTIDDDIKLPPESVEARRRIAPPVQLEVALGSVVLRDIRLWHAGMPNRTSEPRPMIAMIHACGWYPTQKLRLPKDTESFFQSSPLTTDAEFVEGSIDHIGSPSAYEYARG